MFEEWGALEQYSERDWIVWWMVNREDIWYPKFVYEDKRIQYDQNEYKRNTCTVYACMWAYSDNFWFEIPFPIRKEIVELAIEEWLDTSIWWYLHKAVALCWDYLNVSRARVTAWSEDFREALNRGFTLVYWYRWNATYNKDKNDDAIVQSNDRWETTYWHAPRLISAKVIDEVVVVDNYETREINIYTLPEYSEKIKNWEMFRNAYFYFDEYTPPMSILPEHMWPEEFDTELQKETVKAWESEMQKHISNGWELLYSRYASDDSRDKNQILSRYLNDLQNFRGS